MDDIDSSSNKTFRENILSIKNKKVDYPIKQLYLLQGKHFIVIDNSITDQLRFSDRDKTELYFQQELAEDGSIILRQFKMRE